MTKHEPQLRLELPVLWPGNFQRKWETSRLHLWLVHPVKGNVNLQYGKYYLHTFLTTMAINMLKVNKLYIVKKGKIESKNDFEPVCFNWRGERDHTWKTDWIKISSLLFIKIINRIRSLHVRDSTHPMTLHPPSRDDVLMQLLTLALCILFWQELLCISPDVTGVMTAGETCHLSKCYTIQEAQSKTLCITICICITRHNRNCAVIVCWCVHSIKTTVCFQISNFLWVWKHRYH